MLVVVQAVVLLLLHVVDLGRELDQSDTNVCAVVEFHARNEDSIVGLLLHRLSNLILDSIDNVIVFTFAFDRDVVQSSIDVVLSDLLSSGLGAGLHSSLVVVSRRSLKSDTSFTDEKMDLSQDSIAKGTDEPKLYL